MRQGDLQTLEVAALRPVVDVHPAVGRALGDLPDPVSLPERGADVHEHLKATLGAVEQDLTDGAERELTNRERLLLEQRRELVAQIARMTDVADAVFDSAHGDPDLLGDTVPLLLAQVVADATPEEREHRTARHLQAVAARLAESAGASGPVDPLLAERARKLGRAYVDLLAALPRMLGLDEAPADLAAAVTSLRKAVPEYLSRLEAAPVHSGPRTLGADNLRHLLDAALMPSDLDAAAWALRRDVEEMKIEMARIAHRGFKRTPIADAIVAAREQVPFTTEEAVAWLAELAEQSRDFVDETEWFPSSVAHPLVVHEGCDALRVFLGPVAYVPPIRAARSRGHLFLSSGSREEELTFFSVADLEVLVARFGYPGVHLAACAGQSAPLNTGIHAALAETGAALFGAELELGWPLFAAELMRELQFRDSPAVRLITAEVMLRASVTGWYDLQLALGEIDIDGMTRGLVANAGLAEESARLTALNAYRRPGRLMAAVLGKNSLKALRRTAHGRWRHGYSDRRFYDLVVSNGPIPVSTLADLLEAYSPFAHDEGTLEFELPSES